MLGSLITKNTIDENITDYTKELDIPCGENTKGAKRVNSIEEAVTVGFQYKIPAHEVIFCELNRTGVALELHQVPTRFRVRFLCDEIFSAKPPMYFAVPVKNRLQTRFTIDKRGELMFGGESIGGTTEVALDTCDCSYFRKNKKVLNLNSNSRGDCRGCSYCIHNYTIYDKRVLRDERRLLNEEVIKGFLEEEIMAKNSMNNLAGLEQVAIVTGLFGNENKVIEHIGTIRKVAGSFGFNGTIFYLGSEILSQDGLRRLEEFQPFSMCYSIDCLDRREKMMIHKKGRVLLYDIMQALDTALQLGFEATFSYVVGLDPFDVMAKGIKDFSRYVNRFPIINIYQIQHRQQKKIMDQAALQLDYYLRARVCLEEIFEGRGLRPRNWENYRSLWYHQFNGVDLWE